MPARYTLKLNTMIRIMTGTSSIPPQGLTDITIDEVVEKVSKVYDDPHRRVQPRFAIRVYDGDRWLASLKFSSYDIYDITAQPDSILGDDEYQSEELEKAVGVYNRSPSLTNGEWSPEAEIRLRELLEIAVK